MEDFRILTSCAPPACSCPELEMDDKTAECVIRDDYNGTVKMTYTQFTTLATKFLEHV